MQLCRNDSFLSSSLPFFFIKIHCRNREKESLHETFLHSLAILMAQHSFTAYAVSELSCRESRGQRAALQKTRFVSFRATKRKRGCLGTCSANTCNSFDLNVHSNSVNASKTRKIVRFV